jgi:hypothetical protein
MHPLDKLFPVVLMAYTTDYLLAVFIPSLLSRAARKGDFAPFFNIAIGKYKY